MSKLIIALIAQASLVTVAFAAGNIENGKKLATEKNCVTCHGADLNKPIDPSYPKLAGQHYDYLVQAIKAYQIGGTKALLGRDQAVMGAQVAALKPTEVNDLAAYIASLPGDLVIKK